MFSPERDSGRPYYQSPSKKLIFLGPQQEIKEIITDAVLAGVGLEAMWH